MPRQAVIATCFDAGVCNNRASASESSQHTSQLAFSLRCDFAWVFRAVVAQHVLVGVDGPDNLMFQAEYANKVGRRRICLHGDDRASLF